MSTTNFRTGITAVAVLVGLVSIGYAQTITTFDVPGSIFTEVRAINPAGQITGDYQANGVISGFPRKPDGTITTVDVPGSTATTPVSISPAGLITGDYLDARFVEHGFVRKINGTFTSFDVPGSTRTGGVSINPAGEVTGRTRLSA